MALLAVEDARARILDGVRPLAAEKIALARSAGRILAQDIVARRDQPPFPASAMDGYAVRQTDLGSLPAHFRIVGTSAAGHGFRGVVKPGQAVRILTGAPVPAGADTVVIQENTTRDGDALTVTQPTALGRNIRRIGLDFVKGDLLIEAGKCLSARDIGLAAAANSAFVRVRRKPRVCLFATGDELVLPGGRPRPDQIVSSNSHAISAMASAFGAEVSNLGIVKDSLKATIAAVRKGMRADILLTTGGASVGDHDFVQDAFKACGVTIDFWKIALRPGKPFMYGRKGRLHVMGLPGNPVSALVTAQLFLKPLINAMQGIPPVAKPVHARLASAMPANDSRQDYLRATLEYAEDGSQTVTPFAVQDSSMQRTLQLANCLIIRPPDAPAAAVGTLVPILKLDF